MAMKYLETMMTDSVLRAQHHYYGHAANITGAPERDLLGEGEAEFLATRDSFYLSTVSETGWPYVQHRGGPKGFLKVIDGRTLAFADYRGNRQYLSLGNLMANGRVALILMDHARRTRLKIYAHAEALALDADPALTGATIDAAYAAQPERLLRLTLAAYDWNCPQHITPRFTPEEIAEATAPMRARLAALEAENEALRARLAGG